MRCALQFFAIPLIGKTACRNSLLDDLINGIIAHLAHRFADICGMHNLAPLGKHHLALIIHHIIISQQLFANFKIMGFNLGLGFLHRLVDPGMGNGLALFQPQLLQHTIQPLGAENTHQIIFKR